MITQRVMLLSFFAFFFRKCVFHKGGRLSSSNGVSLLQLAAQYEDARNGKGNDSRLLGFVVLLFLILFAIATLVVLICCCHKKCVFSFMLKPTATVPLRTANHRGVSNPTAARLTPITFATEHHGPPAAGFFSNQHSPSAFPNTNPAHRQTPQFTIPTHQTPQFSLPPLPNRLHTPLNPLTLASSFPPLHQRPSATPHTNTFNYLPSSQHDASSPPVQKPTIKTIKFATEE